MVLTTTEAARRLGISPGRVRAYIAENKLRAHRAGRAGNGRDWLIRESDLVKFNTQVRRPPGRPPTRRSLRRKARREAREAAALGAATATTIEIVEAA